MFNSFDIVEGSGNTGLSGKKMIQCNAAVSETKETSRNPNSAEAQTATESTPVCSNGVCMVTWKPRRV